MQRNNENKALLNSGILNAYNNGFIKEFATNKQ